MDNLLPPGQALSSKYADPGWYTVTTQGALVHIAQNAQTPAQLVLDGDSVFCLHRFQASTNLDAATDFSPNNFAVRITLESGQVLTSPQTVFVPQRIIAPSSAFYAPIPWNINFGPRSVIDFQFQDLSGNAQGVDVNFVLVGIKYYRGSGVANSFGLA